MARIHHDGPLAHTRGGRAEKKEAGAEDVAKIGHRRLDGRLAQEDLELGQRLLESFWLPADHMNRKVHAVASQYRTWNR